MFTDKLGLPLNPEHSRLQDQILQLSGMTWEDYEQLTQDRNNYRASYFEGVITIVSPSQSHEVIERTISILINAYCRQYNLLYFPMGSTTLKNPLTVGKEPDTSYAFDIAKSIPDLAVEVIFSSGSTKDLQKYKYLRVKEVWFWENQSIKFYQLVNSNYVEIEFSFYLPNLSADFLIEFVNRGLSESPLTIEADFIEQLQN